MTAPDPPPELPERVVDGLADSSPDLLRRTAHYLEELAEQRERAGSPSGQSNRSGTPGDETERPADLPEGVPTKATITVKEINDNRYYYWQWREGDKIKSKYKGPVDTG